MSARTGIGWTDATWNPIVGCERVSPGCAHFYAKQLHDQRHRAHVAGKAVARQYAVPFETVQLKPDRLRHPLSWREPRRVLVNGVSDLFHEDVPSEYIATVFAVMAAAARHTFEVLTKRPQRMLDWFAWFPTHYNGPRRSARPWRGTASASSGYSPRPASSGGRSPTCGSASASSTRSTLARETTMRPAAGIDSISPRAIMFSTGCRWQPSTRAAAATAMRRRGQSAAVPCVGRPFGSPWLAVRSARGGRT
jgi:hypothetical protein